jgi:hypothetical protein
MDTRDGVIGRSRDWLSWVAGRVADLRHQSRDQSYPYKSLLRFAVANRSHPAPGLRHLPPTATTLSTND